MGHKTRLKYDIYRDGDDLIKVRLTVYGSVTDFFLGKMSLAGFECYGPQGAHPFITRNSVISILRPEGDDRPFLIEYRVKIGGPGKHGIQGFMGNNIVMFEGGNVLLMPVDVYILQDIELSNWYDSIELNYDFDGNTVIAPFQQENGSVLSLVDFMGCHNLRKSCYAFGNFHVRCHSCNDMQLKVYTEENSPSALEFEGISAIFDYYCGLFDCVKNPAENELKLIFPGRDKPQIMGGAGISTAGYTFAGDKLRDWELLAHRMFHAFFEDRAGSRYIMIPPQLWLYEGLAVYYENISLRCLPDLLKKALGWDPEKAFAKLALRYLYKRLRDTSAFALAPVREKEYMKNGALTEFLHYTQAPLLVKIIESMNGTENNYILSEILSTYKNETGRSSSDIKYDTDSILMNVFRRMDKLCGYENFRSDYLAGTGVIPVKPDSMEGNPQDTLDDLNYFEYVIWTWMRLQDPDYQLKKISIDELGDFYRTLLNTDFYLQEGYYGL